MPATPLTPTQLRLSIAADHERGCRDRHENEPEGWEEAAGAPAPEVRQPDPARGGPLAQQQGSNQKAADREEDVDAQKTAGEEAWEEVIDQDEADGYRAQPVKTPVACPYHWSLGRLWPRRCGVTCGGSGRHGGGCAPELGDPSSVGQIGRRSLAAQRNR